MGGAGRSHRLINIIGCPVHIRNLLIGDQGEGFDVEMMLLLAKGLNQLMISAAEDNVFECKHVLRLL